MAHHIPARLTASEGRRFAFPVGTAFLALAGLTWWRDHPTMATAFASLSVALGVAGALVPAKLGPIYRAWMKLALVISKVTTPLFMGITYYVVLAPIGIVMKVFGRNSMVHEPNGGSFWISRPEGARQSDLNRQF